MYNSDYDTGASDQPSFSVESEYSSLYLENNYEPERYNRLNNILKDITISFDKFLDTHEKYAYLRSIDVDKVGKNDRVYLTDMQCTGIIMQIDGETIVVNVNGQPVSVTKTGIKPVDEYINKLKIPDISLLYTFIRERVDKKMFTEIEYFYVFSEYFKINEKTLYNALPMNIQASLVDELNKKVGIFKNQGQVQNIW